MSLQDREMLSDLILESRDHLSRIEPDLLVMEQNPSKCDDELINRVFRAIHSIKGGFGFFGIEHVTELAHTMENVLSKIRDKKLVINSEITDALFKGIDKLRMLLSDIDRAEQIDISTEKLQLMPYLDTQPFHGTNNGTAESKKSGKFTTLNSSTLSAEMLQKIKKDGKTLYTVYLSTQSDLISKKKSLDELIERWKSMGDVLVTTPAVSEVAERLKNTSSDFIITILYASVLDHDLISTGLDLPEGQITECSLESKTPPPVATATIKATTMETEKPMPKQELVIDETLRVRVALLNNLMNLAGELVLGRNQLLQHLSQDFTQTPVADKVVQTLLNNLRNFMNTSGAKCTDLHADQLEKIIRNSISFKLTEFQGVNSIVQNLDMTTSLLQENIMQTRMQPISVVFSKFPRVIRDLARKMNKEIDLDIVGQEVELDKSIIELLSDPLTHLIRNSADHGIETPEQRVKIGKKPQGKVTLKAYHEGGKVNIEINDDGGGIDPERVKQKALEKKVLTTEKADLMSARDLQKLIFAAGFSTAEVVSDVSGRGVGMDVVKTNIERLGGTIELESEINKGTKIILRLPLTLAIIPSLIVCAEDRRFAIPQVGLQEIVRIRAKEITQKIERVQGAEVLRLRGKLLPLVRLAELLNLEPTFIHPVTGKRLPDKRARWSDRRGLQHQDSSTDIESSAQLEVKAQISEERRQGMDRREAIQNAIKVVVLAIDKRNFGLVVDEVRDTEEIVVKPLSSFLKKCLCYSGATIMGDGRVAMILDPSGIAQLAKLKFSQAEESIEQKEKLALLHTQKRIEDLLLFNLGTSEHFAVKLASVSRIEKHTVEEIQHVGDKEFLKYEDHSIELLRLEKYMPIEQRNSKLEHFFVIVPKNMPQPIGIIAGKVEDVVQVELNLNREQIRGVGIEGSAIVNKNLTLLIDLDQIVRVAEPEIFEHTIKG